MLVKITEKLEPSKIAGRNVKCFPLGNSVSVPQKVKRRVTKGLKFFENRGCIPKRIKNIHLHKNLHTDAHSKL